MENGKKVKKIITRFPNLECGFLAALLMYCENIRRNLNITTGQLAWEFISTASRIENPDQDPEVIYFNTGGGKFDQHSQPENESLCQLCSLDLMRGEYDFLIRRPWLRKIYSLVRLNDTEGEWISRHRFNLRELMTALSFTHRDEPQVVLDWLALAFCGVFERCKTGEKIAKVFDPEQIKIGVFAYCPEKSPWFDEIMAGAITTVKVHWPWAHKAVKKAQQNGRQARIFVPALNREIDVLEVWCDSFKAGSAGRSAGYQIVIQWNQDGHCQIHGGMIKIGPLEKLEIALTCAQSIGGPESVDLVVGALAEFNNVEHTAITKLMIHLGEVAKELRRLEAVFCGRKIKEGQNWTATGFIRYADGADIPWYLPQFLTSLYNGTMSSRDVAPTKIGRRKVFDAICRALPRCGLVVKNGNNPRYVVSRDAAACPSQRRQQPTIANRISV